MVLRKTIGHDTENKPVILGDIERRSGLYILGRSGMGKTNLLVHLAVQAIENGYGLFFLDPHDGIDRLRDTREARLLVANFALLDIKNEIYSFGINILQCKNVESWVERSDTYDRARWVFFKLFEKEFGEKPWFESIIQNTLYVFIENQDYTLAEVPRFLTNPDFRNYLLSKVRYKPDVVDFWKHQFHPRQAESALTRMTTLLGHDVVRHIVGQRETTLDFGKIMEERRVILVKIPATLAPDIKKFIGTILISELLHAVRSRPEDKRNQFCIFIDEFQHFVNYEDFGILITEARKYGIATTISHQERFWQLGDNKQIIGATDATVNKVFFQLSVRDAKEQAPEFAKAPTTTETRLEPELVISQEPFWDMLRRGHANPRIHEIFTEYFRPLYYNLDRLKEEIENERLVRMDLLDETGMYQSEASLSQVDERREGRAAAMVRGRDIPVSNKALIQTEHALERAMSTRGLAKEQSAKLVALYDYFKHYRQAIHNTDRFLTALMEGRIKPVPGQEQYAQFFIDIIGSSARSIHLAVIRLFIQLGVGDPKIPRSIPAILATKYWPGQLQEVYMQERRARQEESYKRSLQDKVWMSILEKQEGSRKLAEEVMRKTFEKNLRDDLKKYREGKITLEFGIRPFIKIKRDPDSFDKWNNEEPLTHYNIALPDLPPRVLTASEIEEIADIIYDELLEDDVRIGRGEIPILRVLEDLVEFCILLTEPKNHIKVPSGQYVVKPVHTRPVHDMTDEMAQELANLPRFTAYAKVIAEKEGEQTVWRGKIKTSPVFLLPHIELSGKYIGHGTFLSSCLKSRRLIEEEIRQRMEKWQGGTSDEPPPTHS